MIELQWIQSRIVSWGFPTVLFSSMLVSYLLGAVAHQPAKPLPLTPGWVKFDAITGSTIYFKSDQLLMIHELTEEDAKEVGYRTRMHIGPVVIRSRLTANEIRLRSEQAE